MRKRNRKRKRNKKLVKRCAAASAIQDSSKDKVQASKKPRHTHPEESGATAKAPPPLKPPMGVEGVATNSREKVEVEGHTGSEGLTDDGNQVDETAEGNADADADTDGHNEGLTDDGNQVDETAEGNADADADTDGKKWWQFLLGEEQNEETGNDFEDERTKHFKRRFKCLTALAFLFYVVLNCFALYLRFSIYGHFALYIVAHNYLMTIHYADERTKHWLKNPKDEHDGLFLRVMVIANAGLVVNFAFAATCLTLLTDDWPHFFKVLTTFFGFIANTATMVMFLASAAVLFWHSAHLFVIIFKNTIRNRLPLLILSLCILAWYRYNLYSAEQVLHWSATFLLHIVFAFSCAFALPLRNLYNFTILRVLIVICAGFIVFYWWRDDRQTTLAQMGFDFRVFYCAVFVLYAPDVGKVDKNGKCATQCSYLAKECYNKCSTLGCGRVGNLRGNLLCCIDKCGCVADRACYVRKVLFDAYVEIPLRIVFENAFPGHCHLVFKECESFLSRSICDICGTCSKRGETGDNEHQATDTTKTADSKPGDAKKQCGRLFWICVTSAVLSFVFLFLLRNDIDYRDYTTWIRAFVVGTILTTFFRVGFYCALASCLHSFLRSKAATLVTSMLFALTFIFIFMLAVYAMFNSFASVVCSDRDDDWFILWSKRLTFYAMTTVCIFFINVGWATMRSSLENRFSQEVLHKFYMGQIQPILRVQNNNGTEGEGGMSELYRKELKRDKEYIRIQRRNLRWFIWLSFLIGAFGFIFIHPSQGEPDANYTEIRSGHSIRMFDMNFTRDTPSHPHVKYQKYVNHTYSACSIRWGGDLTALDHAILALMTKFQPKCPLKQCNVTQTKIHEKELLDMKAALTFLFPEKDYGNVLLTEDWDTHLVRKKDIESGRFHKYYRFDFPKQKHTVVAVRGTDFSDLRDVIVDLRLWTVSVLTDVSEKLITLMNWIPTKNRAYLQWFIGLFQDVFLTDETKLDFYKPVVEYVHEVITTDETNHRKYLTGQHPCEGDDCWTISVAGHSLGGGIASIVGSTLGLSSVSFSGPGFLNSKFQFESTIDDKIVYPNLAKAINLNTVFIPSSDVVPRVDTHIGNIQHTACTTTNPLACHFISSMVCDLLLRCGDNQDQTRLHACEHAAFHPTLDVEQLQDLLLGQE